MGKYLINGGTYEIDESIQGADLNTTLSQLATQTANTRGAKIDSYLSETDKLVGLTPGTSARQINQESRFDDSALNVRSKAAGLAQVIPDTVNSLSTRLKRKLDPHNTDDALLMHRELMRENMGRFGNEQDALRAYNAGWDKKRWANPETENYVKVVGGAAADPSMPGPAKAPFVPFAAVRKNVDPAKLDKDQDWLRASRQLYSLRERQSFTGSDADLAEWGKNLMGNFNSNMVDMTRYANNVATSGTPEDQQAFLFMMDTYDNTEFSWEGAGRAAKGIATDPTSYIGLSTLGIGTGAKVVASTAAKVGIKKLLISALGRTGVIAGVEGGILGAAQSGIKQGVEVTAGRKESTDLGELAGATAVGAGAGVVLGTAADAALTSITNVIRRNIPTKARPVPVEARVDPTLGNPPPVVHEAPVGAPVAIQDITVYHGSENAVQAADFSGGMFTSNKARAQNYAGMDGKSGHILEATLDIKNPMPWEQAMGKTPEEIKAAGFDGAIQWGDSGEVMRAVVTDPAQIRQKVKPGTVPEDLVTKTILTEKEIFEATKRQQQGRLWVDDLPPVEPANPAAAAKLDMPDSNTGLRGTPRSMAELSEDGRQIADQLKGLDDKEMHGVLESFRTAALPLEDMQVVARGVQMHADELRIEQAELIKGLGLSTNAQETTRMAKRLSEIEDRLVPLSLADDAFGSIAGSMLRQRQEGLPGLQGVTVESLMASHGLTKEAAEAEFVKLVEGSKLTDAAAKVASKYDDEIAKALAAGDAAEAAKLTALKQRELAGIVEQEIPGSASFMEKMNEFIISNVFTPTTLAINLIPAGVKTLVLPLARALVTDPLKLATRVQLGASYSAMRSTVGASLRAARAAYRYEQSLLTRGTGRIMEGEMAITGRKAGVIRFFPRLLNATDEFLGQLNYNSFVAGQAAAKAVVEATEKGLTGRQFNEYVKLASEIAMKEAFQQPTGDALIQPLVNKGVNLGLTGPDLHAFVLREAAKDPEALRHGSNEQALDFVRDVLYKRRLSGKGTASSIAQSYEQAMNKTPSMKLVLGQLFFRTPVRVFEEGIRLTPGLQIVAPGFVADLAGKNGMLRQTRAQAEALTSIGMVGAIFTLYSTGHITGDGAPDNWKQTRTQTDGPGQPPYTIRMADGSTWSYRNFDPVATPFKIIINGLERMDKLAIRQAQGEFIDKTQWDMAQAYLHVGMGAIATALRDANLVAGIDQSIKLAENLGDPEGKEDAWLKYMGEKLALLVPNTLHKIAKQNDPTLKDPADFWQVVESRLHIGLRDDIKTTFSYDVLGNVRQLADTGTLWNIFSTATTEERAKGHSSESQKVMLELDRLQKETGAVFSPPMKHKLTGDFDLRTVLTGDKSETLYDRWQRNYRELEPDKILFPIVTADMPDGTHKYKAIRVETINKVMGELRDAAFMKTMAQEQTVVDQVIKTTTGKVNAKAGLLDFSVRDK